MIWNDRFISLITLILIEPLFHSLICNISTIFLLIIMIFMCNTYVNNFLFNFNVVAVFFQTYKIFFISPRIFFLHLIHNHADEYCSIKLHMSRISWMNYNVIFYKKIHNKYFKVLGNIISSTKHFSDNILDAELKLTKCVVF